MISLSRKMSAVQEKIGKGKEYGIPSDFDEHHPALTAYSEGIGKVHSSDGSSDSILLISWPLERREDHQEKIISPQSSSLQWHERSSQRRQRQSPRKI
jgi:hypothetical protein